MAEDLIIDGFAELKSLAGAISITVEGLRALDMEPVGKGDGAASGGIVLGKNEFLEANETAAVEQLLEELKSSISAGEYAYDDLEEMVIDIKTLETQLLSKRPKSAVARALLSSLQRVLQNHPGSTQLAGRVGRMVGG